MKRLAPFTKLHPNDRMGDCDYIAGVLNKKNKVLKICSHSSECEGYILQSPQITLADEKVEAISDGKIIARSFKEIVKLGGWTVIYSVGKNGHQDQSEVDHIITTLI